MLTQKEMKRYINGVKKNYNGPHKTKKRFLNDLTKAIYEFTSDNPDATLKDLENHFGKSDEIKDAFLSTYSDKLKHTRFNKFIIVAVLVLIVLGSSLFFGIRHFSTSYERRNGYYVESIKDISTPVPTKSPDAEPTPLEIIN